MKIKTLTRKLNGILFVHFNQYINYINACNKFSLCVRIIVLVKKKKEKYPCERVVSDVIFKKEAIKPVYKPS